MPKSFASISFVGDVSNDCDYHVTGTGSSEALLSHVMRGGGYQMCGQRQESDRNMTTTGNGFLHRGQTLVSNNSDRFSILYLFVYLSIYLLFIYLLTYSIRYIFIYLSILLATNSFVPFPLHFLSLMAFFPHV